MSNWARPVLDGDSNLLFSSVEEGLTVRLVTTFEPYCCDVDEDLAEVVGRQDLREFDYVPVKENDEIVGLLHRAEHDTEGASGRVRDAMCHLRGDLIISADAGILSYIEYANERPCRLVLSGSRLDGIVTMSDLQRLPVRPAIFLLITHLELLMSDWIRQRCQSEREWIEQLGNDRPKNIEKQWKKLQANDLAIDRLTATHFSDKYKLVMKLSSLEDPEESENELYRIKELRNRVAHAGDYALTQETARETIEVVGLTRKWIRLLGVEPDSQGQEETRSSGEEP